MEKVKRRPLEEQERHDVQVCAPQLEPIIPSEHAVSEPQPPTYEQPGPCDF